MAKNQQERDEEGKFSSEESRDRGGNQSNRQSQRGGEGSDSDGRGWHGDPEGHREAALKGGSGQDQERDDQGRFVEEEESGDR